MAGERAHLIPLVPRPITPEWIERVRKAVAWEGISHHKLAEMVGSSAGTIQHILGPVPPKSCRFADRISKVLHIPLPGIDDEDKEMWLQFREELLRKDPSAYRDAFNRLWRLVHGRPLRPV